MTTLLVTVESVSTKRTCAANFSFGSASTVTVAAWPGLILAASISLKPATTSSWSRSTSVNSGVAAAPVEEELGELDELAVVVPPPLTVSPTEAPIEAIVPSAGASSVVCSSASSAVASAASAVATFASAAAMSLWEAGLPFTAFAATVDCLLSRAVVRDCWAFALDCALRELVEARLCCALATCFESDATLVLSFVTAVSSES